MRCCGCSSRQLPVLCPLQDVPGVVACTSTAACSLAFGTRRPCGAWYYFFLASCCQGKSRSDRVHSNTYRSAEVYVLAAVQGLVGASSWGRSAALVVAAGAPPAALLCCCARAVCASPGSQASLLPAPAAGLMQQLLHAPSNLVR